MLGEDDDRPVVLFLCVHNAGRSQMALGWFNHLADGKAVAWSGGSEPGTEVNPAAIQAMAEVGIDIAREFPKPWTDEIVRAADVVVGKPGGISVAEALACGRPLLATRSLGGQEGFNIAFLQSHEVGGLVADGELLDRLAALLHNPEALQAMQMRAWQLGRREGARRVAQIAVDLAASRESAMYR